MWSRPDLPPRSRSGPASQPRHWRGVASEGRPDLIEIQDFDGLAFHALAHRGDVGVDQVPVQVRFHGPADLMFEAIGVEPPEIAVARSMEVSSFRMADRVVVATPGIGALATDRYGLEADRVVVGTPPIAEPRRIDLTPAPDPTLVCVARLGEVKGTHDLVAAAVPVLRDIPDLRLVLIGEDGWSATARRPMSEWLTTELIPEDVADRIEIAGRREGAALDERIAEAWAIVIPSRFESFNLVAHEARSAGLPVIVPDLAAFDGVLDETTGALVYDGTPRRADRCHTPDGRRRGPAAPPRLRGRSDLRRPVGAVRDTSHRAAPSEPGRARNRGRPAPRTGPAGRTRRTGTRRR